MVLWKAEETLGERADLSPLPLLPTLIFLEKKGEFLLFQDHSSTGQGGLWM